MSENDEELSDADYAALAAFRYALRKFQAFSEAHAALAGLTPQQHQVLLAIRATEPDQATVGFVAERLILKPHSATGLIDRLEDLGLVIRKTSAQDRRRTVLHLTEQAHAILAELSAVHREEIRGLHTYLSEILTPLV